MMWRRKQETVSDRPVRVDPSVLQIRYQARRDVEETRVFLADMNEKRMELVGLLERNHFAAKIEAAFQSRGVI